MLLDPRSTRVSAAFTGIVLALVLATGSAWLALLQVVVFVFTAISPAQSPYAWLYQRLIAPSLPPPAWREPAAPVRFSQLVGLAFVLPAAVSYLAGAALVGAVLTGVALTVVFLNAAFGLCLGCELYLAVRRLAGRPLPRRAEAGR